MIVPRRVTINRGNIKLFNDQFRLPDGGLIFGAPLADEYPVPTKFVVGPDDEMDQYENPGQLFFSLDSNGLFIWIP